MDHEPSVRTTWTRPLHACVAHPHLRTQVERREVPITEVFDGAFTEVAACGTAVVLTPIASITKNGEEQLINKEVGPVCQELYDSLRAIQVGDEPDPFGGTWTVEV